MSIATDYIQDLYQRGEYRPLEAHLRLQRAHDCGDPDVVTWSALCAFSRGDFHAAYRFIAPLAVRSSRKGEVHALLGKVADVLKMAPCNCRLGRPPSTPTL